MAQSFIKAFFLHPKLERYYRTMNAFFWLELTGICFIGAVSPGPSLALVVHNTVTKGKMTGLLTSIGHGFGIGIWAILTASGVTQLIVSKPGLLTLIQIMGGCLLVYIGGMTVFSSGTSRITSHSFKSTLKRFSFSGADEGFLISVLNPKIMIFFLAIFSQFVEPTFGWSEAVVMALIAASVDAIWYSVVTLILTGQKIVTHLYHHEKTVQKIAGSTLITVGILILIFGISN